MSLYGADPVAFESVSAVTATNTVKLGTQRVFDGEHYEYVYSIGQVSKGLGAAYSGTSGHSVAATGVVSGEMCAGFVKHATFTTATYGWLLKKGVVDVRNGMTGSALVAADRLILLADGEVGHGAAADTGVVAEGHLVGKLLSAGASGGTGASLALIYASVY